MSRTVVIAQARMSSTRLPGKVLMDLGGMPVVDHVIARTKRARLVDDVIIATTTDPTDDVLASHLDALGTAYVRGDLDDVLSRYILAARATDAETIVRVTCDCPLIDPAVIDEAIEAFRATPEADYCSNTLVRTYPIGMDTEVFSLAALERASDEALQTHEREHVTPYLYQHPELFRLRNVESPTWANRPHLRLTVDELSDLEMIRSLIAVTGSNPTLADMLEALDEHPEIAALNASVNHRHVAKPDRW